MTGDFWVNTIGSMAAILTTICWLPQTIKIFKSQDAQSISLSSQLTFGAGVIFWLIYGILLSSKPIIFANVATLSQVALIIYLKLKHGY
jgi:MtN3 and saliva related transmembrane protein